MKNKDIDTKILYKFVQKNYRLYPVYEKWKELSKILFAGYKLEMEMREIENRNRRNIIYNFLRKPDWLPKPHLSDKIKQYILKKHIAYAANLNNQDILNKFGFMLIGLKKNEWVYSKIKNKRKKSLKDNIEELSKNTKVNKIARQLIKKNKLIKRSKFK